MLPDGLHDVPNDRIAAVVTSLEMWDRPEPRAEARGAWKLQRLDRPDPASYRALYSKIGDRWLWFSRLLMSDGELAAIVHDPAVEVYGLETGELETGEFEAGKLEAGGAFDGMLELDFRVAGECELAFFGVASALIGGGAARWMMNRALERAWRRPIRRFWVHTCTLDHPGAIAFYRRSGFVPFRRQIEIEPDPRLQGVSMESREVTPVLAPLPPSGR